MSKFCQAGFLIFVLLFVSHDLEFGGVPSVSPFTKSFSDFNEESTISPAWDWFCTVICHHVFAVLWLLRSCEVLQICCNMNINEWLKPTKLLFRLCLCVRKLIYNFTHSTVLVTKTNPNHNSDSSPSNSNPNWNANTTIKLSSVWKNKCTKIRNNAKFSKYIWVTASAKHF